MQNVAGSHTSAVRSAHPMAGHDSGYHALGVKPQDDNSCGYLARQKDSDPSLGRAVRNGGASLLSAWVAATVHVT